MGRVLSKEALQKRLGKHIAHLREREGLTQEELAFRCDKDKQSINRLERGHINPSAYYLTEIAAGLGIPVKELLDFECP